MLLCTATIQEKSAPIIKKAYRSFLLESCNPEEREFLDDESQIREILVHGNYLSLEDVKIAKEWDISELASTNNFQNIQSLSQTLRNLFEDDEW